MKIKNHLNQLGLKALYQILTSFFKLLDHKLENKTKGDSL